MLGIRAQIVFALAVLLSCTGRAFGTQRHIRPKSPAKQQEPAPQLPPPPPSPRTLAQMPASPPQVSYSNGALTIVAHNSTLGDILRAVHTQTGAVMDISGNATERVVSRFGPGSPRDVLAQLLTGSSFNYVILGSPVDAGMVQRVVLSPKSPSGTETAEGATNAPNPLPRTQLPGQASQDMSDDESEDANDSEAQDQQATTPPGSEPQANQPQANQPQVKTPEQLLQELQRQQQLQQQQQQTQPGGAEPQPQPNPRQQ